MLNHLTEDEHQVISEYSRCQFGFRKTSNGVFMSNEIVDDLLARTVYEIELVKKPVNWESSLALVLSKLNIFKVTGPLFTHFLKERW